MCAAPKRPKLKKPAVVAAPRATDAVADEASEKELRRLRTLYGRRATILTPERAMLGQAPTSNKNLLGA